MATGLTTYSKTIPGTRHNYNWPVWFDMTDGCLGITQFDEAGKVTERVLLSQKQVQELKAFIAKR